MSNANTPGRLQPEDIEKLIHLYQERFLNCSLEVNAGVMPLDKLPAARESLRYLSGMISLLTKLHRHMTKEQHYTIDDLLIPDAA